MTTQQFTIPENYMTAQATLPEDWQEANLVGRVMTKEGPSVVYLSQDGYVVDITHRFATMTDLLEQGNPAEAAHAASKEEGAKIIGKVDDILANSAVRDASKPYLLSPADFEELEASGVTFVDSLIERMIEQEAMKCARMLKAERNGDLDEATFNRTVNNARTEIRKAIEKVVGEGFDFSTVVPGSEDAKKLIDGLEKAGLSTIYPKVGFGKEGEIFSKAAAGTSVGHGAQAGYTKPTTEHKHWVNPEPEVALFVNSKGEIKGAANGNDINDRAKEGETALLLHRAKVKNGSTSIGPFVRLFDGKFTMEDVKKVAVELEVRKANGEVRFVGQNNMAKISRKPEDIVAAAMDEEREHPQGMAIMLGTAIVPNHNTDEHGKMIKGADGEPINFTHEPGDVVRIGSGKLGYLTNVMLPADQIQELEKGTLDLATNLANRHLLQKRTPIEHATRGGSAHLAMSA